MKSWSEFAAEAPEMAAAGYALMYRVGLGLGYLATLRKDGAPRLHPFCPVVHASNLYALIALTPKLADLIRDPRYAYHSFPAEEVDDEFYLNGVVRRADEVGEGVRAEFVSLGGTTTNDEVCFELLLGSAMLATYAPRPSWPPTYTTWRAANA